MLREMREALDTLNLEAPLLFVMEDLQWVDPSTIDLISALARQQTAKTMWVITKRPVDMVAPEHPLKRLKQDLLVHHLCSGGDSRPAFESGGGRIPGGRIAWTQFA